MKLFFTALIWTFSLLLAYAGEVYDLGERRIVPDWAVGPLLVVPVERVQNRRLAVSRSETIRIGTLQASYIELSEHRYRFASIRLSEIPNDSYSCHIKTVTDKERYLDIHLSQSLFDQTFYFIYINTMNAATNESIEKQCFAVWDAKSRK